MKRTYFFTLLSMLVGLLLTIGSVESHAQNALAANTAFDTALAAEDRAALDTFLDPEFSWIFPDGSFYGRSETLAALPASAPSTTGEPISVTERAYGRVRALEVSSGLVRALRIWIMRSDGWRLIHMNELVKGVEPEGDPGPYRPAYRDTVSVPDCDNPCETVPYVPATQRSRDVLLSWQQQELGGHTMDMDLWGAYVTDDWVAQRAGGSRNSKTRRIALTDRREANGVTSTAQSTVLQMRLYDLNDAVLMVSLTQGLRGRPQYRTRIFIRDGERADGGPLYKMAESYGQSVVGTPVFERIQD